MVQVETGVSDVYLNKQESFSHLPSGHNVYIEQNYKVFPSIRKKFNQLN